DDSLELACRMHHEPFGSADHAAGSGQREMGDRNKDAALTADRVGDAQCTDGEQASRAIEGAGTTELAWQNWPGLHTLPLVQAAQLVPEGCRAWVIAPHPDDEILGCGGLIRSLVALGRAVTVLAVTDGTASHPGSALWTPEQLGQIRASESLQALEELGTPDVALFRLGFDDGQLMAQARRLQEVLERRLAPRDVVFATWQLDGHPDHEAVGAAALAAAAKTGATVIQVPVWMWHWARPGDPRVPWPNAVRLQLDLPGHAAKQRAAACFRSQLQSDPTTGNDAIVGPGALERLMRREEVFFMPNTR
ncbi:MAG: PIG-L deacetylase family protein, partial [Janthinobacterium lividum]